MTEWLSLWPGTHSLSIDLPLQLNVVKCGKPLIRASIREGANKLECVSISWTFQGTWFCLACSEHCWDLARARCLGAAENRRQLIVCCCFKRPVVQHTETSAAWWPLPSLWKKTSVCLQCCDLSWGALETAFPDLGLTYSICLEATDNKTELDGLF